MFVSAHIPDSNPYRNCVVDFLPGCIGAVSDPYSIVPDTCQVIPHTSDISGCQLLGCLGKFGPYSGCRIPIIHPVIGPAGNHIVFAIIIQVTGCDSYRSGCTQFEPLSIGGLSDIQARQLHTDQVFDRIIVDLSGRNHRYVGCRCHHGPLLGGNIP